MSGGDMSWRFHSDLPFPVRQVVIDWARANGLDTNLVPFDALFTIHDGTLTTEVYESDRQHRRAVTVPLVVPLPSPFQTRPGALHDSVAAAPWRFDVPEVPDSVTALRDRDGDVWLRQEWPRGFAKWPGTWWACQHADGDVGPTAHFTDIVSHAPLVECEDPRKAAGR